LWGGGVWVLGGGGGHDPKVCLEGEVWKKLAGGDDNLLWYADYETYKKKATEEGCGGKNERGEHPMSGGEKKPLQGK